MQTIEGQVNADSVFAIRELEIIGQSAVIPVMELDSAAQEGNIFIDKRLHIVVGPLIPSNSPSPPDNIRVHRVGAADFVLA